MRFFRLIPLVLLGSCHLVDQRDFDHAAGVKPVHVVAAVTPAPPPPALVSIRFAASAPNFQPVLATAVKRALQRKPDALFVVTTLVPPVPQIAAEADEAMLAAAHGRDVAQGIVAAGAATSQVEQKVRVQPGLDATEVDVTVQ